MELNHKINCGILIAVLILGILAYFSFIGHFNEFYYTPSTRKAGFVSQLNPDFPEELDVLVFLKTSSLNAQSPINVEVKVLPSEHFYQYKSGLWEAYSNKFYIIFPDALKYPVHQYAEGDFEGAIIELNKSNNPREFTGNDQIIFQQGGKFGWTLVSQDFIDKHRINENKASLTLSDITPQIGNLTLFTIGEPHITADLQTNNLILTLTLLAFAVSIVQSRNHIVGGVTWIYEKTEKKHRFVTGVIILIIVIGTIICFVHYLDGLTVKKDNEYGFKLVSKTYDFEITRLNTNWFFIKDVAKRVKQLGLPIPTMTSMIDDMLIQKYSGEAVFVGVFNEPNLKLNSEYVGNTMSNMFEYYGLTEFTYTIKKETDDEIEITGKHADSKTEITIRFIKKSNSLFIIESIVNSNSNEITKKEIEKISASFNFCSNQIFSCLKT